MLHPFGDGSYGMNHFPKWRSGVVQRDQIGNWRTPCGRPCFPSDPLGLARKGTTNAAHPSSIAPGKAPGTLPERGVTVEGFDPSELSKTAEIQRIAAPDHEPPRGWGGSRPGQTAGEKHRKGREAPFWNCRKAGEVFSRTSADDAGVNQTFSA